MTRIVALTGNIGSGKSTVGRLLEQHGAVRIDSDVVAREVVAPGTDGLAEIVAEFGNSILAADGSLDREALGRIVFRDNAARARLEALTHPRIRTRMAERIATALASPPPLIVVEIPLLFETGLEAQFPLVLLVTAPAETRAARVAGRDGLPAADVAARLAAQMPEATKRERATWVLENDGSEAALTAGVARLWPALTGNAEAEL